MTSIPPRIAARRVWPARLESSPGWWRITADRPGQPLRTILLRAESIEDAARWASQLFSDGRHIEGEKLRTAIGEPI
jgi:hypothetical protein